MSRVAQSVERWAHNPEVAGSSPAPATKRPRLALAVLLSVGLSNPGCGHADLSRARRGLEVGAVALDVGLDRIADTVEKLVPLLDEACRRKAAAPGEYDSCMAPVRDALDQLEAALTRIVAAQEHIPSLLDALADLEAAMSTLEALQ